MLFIKYTEVEYLNKQNQRLKRFSNQILNNDLVGVEILSVRNGVPAIVEYLYLVIQSSLGLRQLIKEGSLPRFLQPIFTAKDIR